ncbi:MAG: mechanosensitive ion channel [Alphaproteobacteria bacterium]|nr:mechanosensitive ion channel [Alphaproteobacteria bacterium]
MQEETALVFFQENNYVYMVLLMAIVVLIILAFVRYISVWLYRLAKVPAKETEESFAMHIFRHIGFIFAVSSGVWVGLSYLVLPADSFVRDIKEAMFFISLISLGYGCMRGVQETFIVRIKNLLPSETLRASFLPVASILTQITVWIVVLGILLVHWGVNLTSLLAGLGVGTVAVAFAMQKVIGEFFSTFAILLDRPFLVGDYIQARPQGTTTYFSGTVEHIGIKSTQLRASNGELIIVPNHELSTAEIQNFRRLTHRRVILHIDVLYNTDMDLLPKIPSHIEKMVSSADVRVSFESATLVSIGEGSYKYETIYYIETADYKEHRHIQEKVLLNIAEGMKKLDITMNCTDGICVVQENTMSQKKK